MVPVTLTGENGIQFKVLAETQYFWIPDHMSTEDRRTFFEDCEIHLYSVKSGRRLKAYEAIMTDSDWKSVAKQMDSAADDY